MEPLVLCPESQSSPRSDPDAFDPSRVFPKPKGQLIHNVVLVFCGCRSKIIPHLPVRPLRLLGELTAFTSVQLGAQGDLRPWLIRHAVTDKGRPVDGSHPDSAVRR